MSNSLPDFKRRALESRRAQLLEEYGAVIKQQGHTLSAADALKLRRQAEALEAEIAEIEGQLQSRASQPAPATPPTPAPTIPIGADFVLVTALPEELHALLAQLPGHSQLPPSHDDIRTYYQATLPVTFSDGSTGQYSIIVLSLLGMGRVQAAAATSDAIRRWHPRYIMLIGIAGGIAARKVRLGDILISEQVVDYELQKLTPQGPEVRWEVHRADARLLDAGKNFRTTNWQQRIKVKRPRKGEPGLHFGPIASGDKVIAFAEVLTRYLETWPKLLGVEMEAAGVATAAFQAAEVPGFFMVRGVSDLADEAKGSSSVEKWRAYACDVAAAFAIALLESGPIPLSDSECIPKVKMISPPISLTPEPPALQMARRALAILETQAGAYAMSEIPAHLQLNLEEKRKQVEELEVRWRAGKL